MLLSNWLSKPYPALIGVQQKLGLSVLFGLFVYLFLFLFQPFGIYEIAVQNPWYTIGFGAITTGVMFLNYTISPVLFPFFFKTTQWTIGKELLLIGSHVVAIIFFNYYYNIYSNQQASLEYSFSYFVFMTTAIGSFPITFYLFSIELSLSKKATNHPSTHQSITHQSITKKSITHHQPIHHPSPIIPSIHHQKIHHPKKINLTSESSKEILNISPEHLVFIKSEGNYCKVYYWEAEQLCNKLLRVSLKNIEQQLINLPDFVRCHRSYMVNTKHIVGIVGKARSHYLQLKNCSETVSLSRNYPKETLL